MSGLRGAEAGHQKTAGAAKTCPASRQTTRTRDRRCQKWVQEGNRTCGLLPSPQWGAAKLSQGRAIAVDPESRVGGIDRDKGKALWLPNRRYSCRSSGPCGRLSRSSQGTGNPLCCASSFSSGTIGYVHPAGAVVAADMSERYKLPRAPVRRPGPDRSSVVSAIPGI